MICNPKPYSKYMTLNGYKKYYFVNKKQCFE